MSIHRYIGCLHEIEIHVFKSYGYLIRRKIGQTLNCATWVQRCIMSVINEIPGVLLKATLSE